MPEDLGAFGWFGHHHDATRTLRRRMNGKLAINTFLESWRPRAASPDARVRVSAAARRRFDRPNAIFHAPADGTPTPSPVQQAHGFQLENPKPYRRRAENPHQEASHDHSQDRARSRSRP